MGGLTTRQRFALFFSLYVFSFFVILYAVFFLALNLFATSQLRNEIALESKEIIANNLLFDKNLVFIRDQSGASLREYLIMHNTAAIFTDSKKNTLRTYGIFALGDLQKSNEISLLTESTKGKPIVEGKTVWQNQQLATSVITLKNNKNIVGYIILGKSLEEFNSFKNIMSLIFLSLGALGLVSSFFAGYFISKRAFYPLNKMIKVIEEIELNKLDSFIPSIGHPKDEIVRLSEQFNKMLVRLKEMSSRQQAFIANASHELRTPLTRAISSFDLLSLAGESKTEAKAIRKDLFEIDTILEKLLLLTKLKKDIKTVNSYVIDTEDLFKTLKNSFAKELAEKRQILKKTAPGEIEIAVPYEYLLIILKNLISNSIKYTDRKKRIDLIIERKLGRTVISVRDEGIGLAQNELRHIFNRFYRGKGNRKKGYGVGLSLVKQICDLYGIKIQTVSEINKGTMMTLILPPIRS